MPLSKRIRPNSEAAPWVLEEIKTLEAEVERLRAAITRFVNQYPWQQGPEIQELKALKEGEP